MHSLLSHFRNHPTDLVAAFDSGKKDDGIPKIWQPHVGKRLKYGVSPDGVLQPIGAFVDGLGDLSHGDIAEPLRQIRGKRHCCVDSVGVGLRKLVNHLG